MKEGRRMDERKEEWKEKRKEVAGIKWKVECGGNKMEDVGCNKMEGRVEEKKGHGHRRGNETTVEGRTDGRKEGQKDGRKEGKKKEEKEDTRRRLGKLEKRRRCKRLENKIMEGQKD
jgi:hypothetical protein